jgi:hypothetical protein
MIADYYSKIPKKAKIAALFALIVLIGYFIFYFITVDPKSVPSEFLMARQEASAIAEEIVGLSSQSAGNLTEISRLDQEGKYSDALNLISEELERNRQAREKAIGLSSQLELMATNIAGISPASASQVALQAVSSETTLISRLITYNDYLNQLLEVLRDKFMGLSNGNSIPDLISKINNEATAINDLNKKFNDLIEDFDSF